MKKLSIEDKELLLKDLSARLPYGVAISQGSYDENPIRLNSISITSIGTFFNGYFTEGIYFTFNGEGDIWPKPCLRPMSSMTEEEAMEIAILHDIKDILLVKVTSDYIDVIVDDGVCSIERRTIWYDEIVSSIKCFDWLNAHHFDYRGLIEKGLALEAPDGMYKL